jgi:hypothetical protein
MSKVTWTKTEELQGSDFKISFSRIQKDQSKAAGGVNGCKAMRVGLQI